MIKEIMYIGIIGIIAVIGYQYYKKFKKKFGGVKFNKGLMKGKYVIVQRKKTKGLMTLPEWKNARAFYKDHLGYKDED